MQRQSVLFRRFIETNSCKMSSVVDARAMISQNMLDHIDSKMQSFKCGAHDFAHVQRVSSLALHIADKEKAKKPDLRVTYVAGLLHDMLDSKLIEEGTEETLEKDLRDMVVKEMKSSSSGEDWTDAHTEHVFTIIKSVGYKNMIREDWKPNEMSIEYQCVQDADLLDAIGSIGVARCYAFGGKRARPLFTLEDVENHVPSAEEYKNSSKKGGSGVEHFFEKLLLIKDLIITDTGKEIAMRRHKAMVQFLDTLSSEIAEVDELAAGVLTKRLKQI